MLTCPSSANFLGIELSFNGCDTLELILEWNRLVLDPGYLTIQKKQKKIP
jgi:hypothetical protein